MNDFICVTTWDPRLQKSCYHYVHKSIKDPVQYVKNLNPNEISFTEYFTKYE
ncbi:hypothetical protein SBM3_00162 [Synechococcus phage S-BM3]|nr:hypothetical protein SBM3_00162 [Synechococcus phage S-BM3]